MTNLPAIQENNISMTSQEIAELLDVRHDSVKRSIERLVELGVINQPPLVDGEKSANHVVVKAQCHIISEQDKRYHDLADIHIEVMSMLSTLVQTKPRNPYFEHENWSNC